MAMLLEIALFALSLVVHSSAQDGTVICAWAQSRAGTVRDTLYIDGGVTVNNTWSSSGWTDQNPGQRDPPAYLYKFNYSTPFSYQDTPPNLDALLGKEYLTVNGARYNARLYRLGALFADDFELYTYGGTPVTGGSDEDILNYRFYSIEGQTLFDVGPDLNYPLSGVDNYVTAGASVSIPAQNLSFYFSGLRSIDDGPLTSSATEYEISNTMIKIDMSSPGHATWTPLQLQDDVPGRASAQVVWLPVSGQGILLVIGGVIYPQEFYGYWLTEEETRESQQQSPGFMTTIDIYDIETETWFRQETAGEDRPGQLMQFCAVAAGEAGDDSFEIFIYGGDNGLSSTDARYALDDVWILSVPSFTWTKIPGTREHGRSGHVCSRPLPDQMLLVGGWDWGNEDGYCIRNQAVIDVFNLNSLQWTRQYDPQAWENYTTNADVKKSPKANLETGVRALFAAPYPGAIKQWYPYPKVSTSGSNNVATIAGGAAGGGAVALLTIFLIVYCWPSRRQARKARSLSSSGTSSTRISRWRHGIARPSTDMAEVPKDASSVTTTTEVEAQLSPPLAAEAYGDYMFHQQHNTSPSPHMTPGETHLSPTQSPRQVSYQSLPPRSPHSLQAQSFEADGEEVHEKDGDARITLMSDLGQGPLDFRQHSQYPYSIDRIARSDNGSHSCHPLGSNISHTSSRPRQHSYTAPSPVPTGSLHEVDNGQVNANEMGAGTVRPPMHQRYSSGISSELPLTPPAIDERLADEIAAEMQMRPTSGPLAPLYQYHDGIHEDATHTEVPARGVGSPTSEYDTINTVSNTETGGMSGENTLRGDAMSPMSEKMRMASTRPTLASMANISAELSRSHETETGTSSSSGYGTRRKPVGGAGRSAYEEDQRLRKGR